MSRIKTLALTRGFRIAELSRMNIGPPGARESFIRCQLQMDNDLRHWNLLLTDGRGRGLDTRHARHPHARAARVNRRPEYPQLQLPGMPDSAPYSNRDTSMEAAIEITMHLARLEEIVLTAIRISGAKGLCDHEGEAATGLIHQTYSARRRTLVLKGMVTEGAEKRTTPSGRKSIAWVAATRGDQNFTT